MDTSLNTELLASMLKDKRADRGLREISEEIGGVSAATLSRIEQGKIPDVATFIRICAWLKVSTDTFILKSSNQLIPISNRQQAVAHLRADRELSKETVQMLVNLIEMAYKSEQINPGGKN